MSPTAMADRTNAQSEFRNLFADYVKREESIRGTWVEEIRHSAMNQFLEIGLPTSRDEEWKFTNVSPIAKTQFELARRDATRLASDVLARFEIPGLSEAPRIVFVNGQYSSQLSNEKNLPKSVRVLPLSIALQQEQRLVEPHLNGTANRGLDAFGYLNTAFLHDGVMIHIGAESVLDRPLYLLSIAVPSDEPIMMHPRNVIVAERNSEATIIERYVSHGECAYLTNAMTDIDVAENAQLTHYLLEEESSEAFNISTLRVKQQQNSRVASHTVLLGGKLVRNNVYPILDGEYCDCLINGLFIGSGVQHLDNHMLVDHVKPHGDSRQFYKGILNDKASGVFSGRIIVRQDAQKTDAKQTNRNLLLSDDAQINTKPQLEIYADDVKCTHGATTGQIDEQAIFYLRARGISEDSARSMLIHAFAAESLNRMKLEPIRSYIDSVLLRRLPGGDFLEKIL